MTEVNEARDSSTFLELARVVRDAEPMAAAAQQRLFHARDEVTRLTTLLASAKAEADHTEREYERSRLLLAQMFDHLREEHHALLAVERGIIGDDTTKDAPPPKG